MLKTVARLDRIVKDVQVDSHLVKLAKELRHQVITHMFMESKSDLTAPIPCLLTDHEREMCKADSFGKIRAIKSLRERTGMGLKEAKDIVELYMEKTIGKKYFQ